MLMMMYLQATLTSTPKGMIKTKVEKTEEDGNTTEEPIKET